jgi:hypothetical protein
VTAVRVSPAWLRLREGADAAARSAELAARLPPARVIHDLGAGSGAMGRWLAPLLPRPQHWVLHDRDEDLLARAVPPPGTTLETRYSDLGELTPADLDGADLVVASALLDLLTADDLAAVLEACAGRPLLLTLTVTGRVGVAPPDPLDADLARAFNDHQRRAALGPDAVAAAVERLDPRAEIHVRPSPWRLGSADAELTAEWLDGWVGAACEQEPELAAEAGGYRDQRWAQAAAGALAVTVGHADLLVLP